MKSIFKIFKTNKWLSPVLVLSFSLLILNFVFPLPDLKPYSQAVYSSDGTLLTAFLSKDEKWRLQTKLEEVSPELITAIINKEDKTFFWHSGVDFFAVAKALYNNITKGKVVSGASTITMQVARILEPKRRTFLNKIVEVLRAFQIELHYSKKEILEIYLSHLPLGGNVEGIKSASYIYFDNPPATLSLSQAILLSIIPGDPNSLRLDRMNDKIRIKRDYWIKRFKEEKIFPENDLNDAIDEPITSNRYAIPYKAPHLCYLLRKKYDEDRIESTLNMQIQQTTENILWNYINRIRSKSISNGAVIVIDNRTNSVVGYCGSADFYDEHNAGQVNGIIAERSPGSTLKPALYAIAIERGFITPGTKLLDVPIEIGGYEPENFDEKFYGLVSTEQALVNSLNIPAVELLYKIGTKDFIEFMESTGFKKITKNKTKLGLSLILGGCGVTLEELTSFYTVFSHEGELKKLKYINNEEDYSEEVFSEETAYLIAEILSGKQRNDMLVDYDYSKLPRFAYKTGTSYGKRDAWAIGFNPNYTIGVWVGNFNGSGSPYLTGAEAAIPLLADLFNALDYKSKNKWFSKPENIYERDVCFESGLLPTPECKNLVKELAVKNQSHNEYCNLHQTLYVSEDESIQYCKECLPLNHFKKVNFTIQKPELISWFSKNNIPFVHVPEHNNDCPSRRRGTGPKIVSPSENFEYFIEANSQQEIVLMASSNPGIKYHYWYVNDKFIKRSQAGQRVFYKPEKAEMLNIVCMDDQGSQRSVKVSVKSF
ncbi:MAG: penicillin-binding protein 1C [Ignavibacteriales bacterium]|nr:MAG: penicillin-binding protein 1C [Ignavibacteriales bacterium]